MEKKSAITENPLGYSKEVLRRVREQTDSVVVAYSGGKDSIVTLDLIMRYGNFERVEAFYCYLVKNISFVDSRMEWARKKYGITIHNYPHPDLSRLLRYNSFRPKSRIADNVRLLRFADVDKAVRYDTGIPWLAYGWKRTDSLDRIGALHNLELNAIDPKGPRLYPISRWSHKQVLKYIETNKLVLPETFGGRKMTGVGMSPKDLSAIEEFYPEDFQRILRVFPFAKAIIDRHKDKESAKAEEKRRVMEARKQQKERTRGKEKGSRRRESSSQGGEVRDGDDEADGDSGTP